jgi:GR25 family glycosyltransferase involved in LPS biosynthesis
MNTECKNNINIVFETNYKIKIVNLEKRVDRKEAMIEKLKNANITNYEFIKGIDGSNLLPDKYLYKLFFNNDFNYRRGFIGCALTHYALWKNLLNDCDNDYYIILEDDIEFVLNYQEKINEISNHFAEKEMIFFGYCMFERHRKLLYDVYYKENNVSVQTLNKSVYIGGTGSYSINKSGAKKLIHYIEKNGIQNGIDYFIKICPDINIFEIQPFLTSVEWVEDNITTTVDSDIQYDYNSLNFSQIKKEIFDKYVFITNLDYHGSDLYYNNASLIKLIDIADKDNLCVGFNTLGFFKNKIELNKLCNSNYFKTNDGIYIKTEYYEKLLEIEKNANVN